jgi:hypothetical protein
MVRKLSFTTVLVLSASPVLAQEVAPRAVFGTVRTTAGEPVAGANVFLLETLDGALSDAAGGFSFETRYAGPATLVVRRTGYAEQRVDIVVPLPTGVVIALIEILNVDAIVVAAGSYTAGDEQGATLTSLQVVTTPGTQGDIARAIQTLPGVQNVDGGSGLFVRGGDQSETKIFLNDAVVINPLRLEEPTGSLTPTVDPFFLDRIFFSSGGFGARYGNALSAVVDLSTLGRPPARAINVGANLAEVDASVSAPIGESSVGVRGTASRWHIGPILAVNGSPRDYDLTPQGYGLSGSVAWDYDADGEVKIFAITEADELAIEVEEASFDGTYALDADGYTTIATWHDLHGRFAPSASVSRSKSTRAESQGVFALRTELVSTQVFGQIAWAPVDPVLVTMGAEWERLEAAFKGQRPSAFDDRSDDASSTRVDGDRTGDRRGAFVEGEFHLTPRLRLTTGLRTDRSTLTGDRTLDPRISMAYRLSGTATLVAAWGVYHQIPDPLFFEPDFGGQLGLDPQRARQVVIGLQAGEPSRAFARIETYWKRYRDLVQLDRNDTAVAGGVGSSRGLDLFATAPLPMRARGRIAYSLVDAERTDPNTGLLARAEHDVTHSLTLVGERSFGDGWSARFAYRYATGRPFTDVASATFDPTRDVFVPEFDAPFGERLPDFHRLDLAGSKVHQLGDTRAVFYASLSNLFDRENVLEFRFSDDYTQRFPVENQRGRSVFFGVSVTR